MTMAEILNLPIDISSLIWVVVAFFFYGGMKLYVVYKTSIIPTSRTETMSTFISLLFLEGRKFIADTLPVVKDYKDRGPIPAPVTLDVKKLVETVGNMDERINKIEEHPNVQPSPP